MNSWLWAMTGALALAGCASSGPQGTEAIVQVDVDNAQRTTMVQFPAQLLECGRTALCPTLAASWSSQTPNRAVLRVGTWGAKAKVESIEFHARPHGPLHVRSLAKEAAEQPGVTAFLVPMDTMERVALGKNAWVRVHTDMGVLEETMYDGQGSSPAADAFKRFVYEAYKGTDKQLPKGLLQIFGGDKPYQPNYEQ